jgi:hypothetical protein
MEDALVKKLAKLRAYSGSVKRRNGMYSDIAKTHDRNTVRSLRALQKAPAPGKKLQKIGFILFWIPEPFFITNAIGAPMIIAGKYLDKVYNGSTISDIGHNAGATSTSLNDFKSSIM